MSGPDASSSTPWCCDSRAAECPLCPQYGTRLDDPCTGHPATAHNGQVVENARLHDERRHPAYEYRTTKGPRKQWVTVNDPPCSDDGEPDPTWERNVDAGRPGMGWDRFDYTEESYWRRLKPKYRKPADPCERPECGGKVHTDGWGNPVRCPAAPEEPAAPTPLEEAQATVESLRYQIRRAREALATDEDGSAEAAITRVRTLHKEEYGCCAECTSVHSVSYPCPTIRALDGDTTSREQA